MNAKTSQTNNLDDLFPAGTTLEIPQPGGQTEKLLILPLPLRKWALGFKYIATIAPMLGFNLFDGELTEDEIKKTSGADLWELAEKKIVEKVVNNPDIAKDAESLQIDTQKIYQAITGEGGDLIIEFLAFAINKPVDYFDTIYEAGIDIMVAVINENLNFFVLRLLPKILQGTKSVFSTASSLPAAVKQITGK